MSLKTRVNDGLNKLAAVLSGLPGAAAFVQKPAEEDPSEVQLMPTGQYDLSVERLMREGIM